MAGNNREPREPLKLVIGNVNTPCPDESETECIARQLKQNGFHIFAEEVRALYRELHRMRSQEGGEGR